MLPKGDFCVVVPPLDSRGCFRYNRACNIQKEVRRVIAEIILVILIAGLSYVVVRLFRINEQNEMEQAKRQFAIAQKERAVEIVREVREKRQRIEAGAVKRAGNLTTQMRRDFPTTAPLVTRLAHRSRAMKALQDRKEAARERAARSPLRGPAGLYDEPEGGLSYDYAETPKEESERAAVKDEPRLPWEK